MNHPLGFTGSPLDRADALRSDPAACTALFEHPEARVLVLDHLEPELSATGALRWRTVDEIPPVPLALLGLDASGRARGVSLTEGGAGAARPAAIFALLDRLRREDAAVYAAARSLVDWHARNGFCAVCGARSEVFRAGWGRRCERCAAEHYPRTDPVVIMLPTHRDRVLVGRQPRFPPNRYSALAGFLEVGESIEESVAREIFEEVGVRVAKIHYVASQPWPFPSQLMIACMAEAEADVITIDRRELEDAMWVTRDEMVDVLAEKPGARFLPPPPYAIARTLFEHWLEHTPASP